MENYTQGYTDQYLRNQARAYLEEAKRMESENHALWCDKGEHAFGPRTKGYERWTKEISDPDTGYLTKITMLVCPAHIAGDIPAVKGEVTE